MTPDPDMPPPTEGVPPTPVPTSVNVVAVAVGDQPAIALEISTPIGMNIFFLSRDTARELGSVLRKAAETGPSLVRPGLVVPQ